MMWMSDSRSLPESVLGSELPAGVSCEVDFAPPAFASFFLRASFSMSSGVVELENAMRRFFGDQTGPDAPLGRSVRIQASPPVSDRIAICAGRGLPLSSFSPPRTNAMRLPSGDQRPCTSCLPLVNRTGASLPEVLTIQIELS